ncbi:MAG: archaetidylserine decarboxylase [Planctomycetota bacterium]
MDPRFLFTLPGIPRRGLSALMGRLARARVPVGMRRPLWGFVGRRLGIEAKTIPGDLRDYSHFLDLFTRALPKDERPLPENSGWLSPADGRLVAHSKVTSEGSWVIKGTPYSTAELLPDGEMQGLLGYQALQIYLSPKDYHRFHAPCDLEIQRAVVEPGDLQPVDPDLVRRSMRVLVTNRRILLHCRDAQGMPFALLYVGALNVGGMRFPFDPTLGQGPWVRTTRRFDPPPRLAAGDEMGRFEFGSTVVVFAPSNLRCLVDLDSETRARCPLLGLPRGPESTPQEESHD